MEMANNHSGSVEHGMRIIKEIGEVVAQTKEANRLQLSAPLARNQPEARGWCDRSGRR
jgi:hypothetical protein